MAQSPKVFILVAVHNRWEMTECFLTSCFQQSYHHFQVLLFDDGSSDGSANKIRLEFPQVHILLGNGNQWWTASMNQLLRTALSKAESGDFILTANNDTILPKHFLQEMINCSLENQSAVVGCSILDKKNKKIFTQAFRINNLSAAIEVLNFNQPILEVDAIGGRGSLIPVKAFSIVKKFDENSFPHYLADIDFFYCLKRSGVKILSSKKIYLSLHPRDIPVQMLTFKDTFFSRQSSANLKDRLQFINKHALSIHLKFLSGLNYLITTVLQWIKMRLSHSGLKVFL